MNISGETVPAGAEDDKDDLVAGAYLWIATRGFLDRRESEELSERLGVPGRRADEVVALLLDLGLVTETNDPNRLVPVSPRAAVAILLAPAEAALEERELELFERRRRLSQLRSQFSRLPTTALPYGTPTAIETLDNKYAVRGAIADIAATCERELVACQPGGGRPAAALAEALPRDLALLARGIKMRSLYQHTARFHVPTQAYASAAIEAGSQIRTVAETPPQMIVIDGQVAFLPHTEHQGGAVVVRDPSIISHLLATFERSWGLGSPYRTGPSAAREASDDLKALIVKLLADGLKDDVVAKRVGMSVRSLRGHVAEIMSQLEARSRFQAGVSAARNGWLAFAELD